jgi:hypothetical protein
MDVYALGVSAWALAAETFPAALVEVPPQKTVPVESIDTVSPGRLPSGVVTILDRCLARDPASRPSSTEVRDLLSNELVRGKHKGLFIRGSDEVFELSQANRNVRLTIGARAITVDYDGLVFRIREVTGDVYVNNSTAVPGNTLPSACVLCFGDASLRAGRTWISFTSSNPEVIL